MNKIISKRLKRVARIDRTDWKQYMVEQHIHDYFKPEEFFAELRKELYAIVIKNYKLEPYKVLTDRIKEYRASGCDVCNLQEFAT